MRSAEIVAVESCRRSNGQTLGTRYDLSLDLDNSRCHREIHSVAPPLVAARSQTWVHPAQGSLSFRAQRETLWTHGASRRRPCPCCPCPVPSSSASFPGDPLDKAPALAPPRPPPRGWVQAGLERRIRPVGVPCLKLSPAFQADQVAAEAQSQPLSCVVIQDLNHQTDSSGPVPRSYSLSFPRSCAAEPCSVACWQGPATSPM